MIRLSVPPEVAEALPQFEGVPVGDSIAVGHLVADTIQIRADELREAVEHDPATDGRGADMRHLVDELDGLARSYQRLVGEREPLGNG